jgi:3-oxoacyl-[acyl-carrier protein] reductase
VQPRSRNAIVVGANGAIGGAIAIALAQADCDVGLIDRMPAYETAAAIEALGRRTVDALADITATTDATGAIDRLAEALGGLDILVNAAGINSFGPAADLAESEWDRVMAINLKAVFFSCQAAIPHLRQRGGGRIISIGSVLGKNGGNARPWLDPKEQAGAGNIAYGASKAGIHIMTAYLARELAASKITVNAVAPGPIATAMTSRFPETLRALIPAGRMGEPREVAAAVRFLASEEAGFITGEVLDVNGGLWSD